MILISCDPGKAPRIHDPCLIEGDGWKAADLHVHSFHSFDVLPARSLSPPALYEKAIRRGMNYVTFTDHDNMEAYGSTKDMDVDGLVRGVEMSLKDDELVGHTIHVNVYDLDEEDFHYLKDISQGRSCLVPFIRYLSSQGIPFTYNHPFWFEAGERPNFEAIPRIMSLFPLVEYNMHCLQSKNDFTSDLASSMGKSMVACTDTHSGNVGTIYTVSQGDEFREFFKNIEKGQGFLALRSSLEWAMIEEVNSWIERIFECRTIKPEMCRFGTSLRLLDWVMRLLSSDLLRYHPKASRLIEAFSHRISNSGLAFYYARRVDRLDPRIGASQLLSNFGPQNGNNYGSCLDLMKLAQP